MLRRKKGKVKNSRASASEPDCTLCQTEILLEILCPNLIAPCCRQIFCCDQTTIQLPNHTTLIPQGTINRVFILNQRRQQRKCAGRQQDIWSLQGTATERVSWFDWTDVHSDGGGRGRSGERNGEFSTSSDGGGSTKASVRRQQSDSGSVNQLGLWDHGEMAERAWMVHLAAAAMAAAEGHGGQGDVRDRAIICKGQRRPRRWRRQVAAARQWCLLGV